MQCPKVGVAVIIKKQDHLLLIRRKRSHGAGSWALPGGHLDFGESPTDCAIREAREEVGLVVNDPRFVALTNDVFSAENKHYITIWMIADCPAFDVVSLSTEEVAEWGWFTWDDLPSPLFLPLENLVNCHGVIFSKIEDYIRCDSV